MPIIMLAYCLLFGVPVPALSHEEVLTKQCHEFGQKVENNLIERGMGESWLHSQPKTQSADRDIERHA